MNNVSFFILDFSDVILDGRQKKNQKNKIVNICGKNVDNICLVRKAVFRHFGSIQTSGAICFFEQVWLKGWLQFSVYQRFKASNGPIDLQSATVCLTG